jgi:hypothetical protein
VTLKNRLLDGELKHEIGRKAFTVAANLLVEALGAHPIEGGNSSICFAAEPRRTT